MIPDIIGDMLVIALIILATIAAGWRVWRGITKDREPEPEPETHGDDGGWPAYGLKRLDGHKHGRVEVTGKAGK